MRCTTSTPSRSPDLAGWQIGLRSTLLVAEVVEPGVSRIDDVDYCTNPRSLARAAEAAHALSSTIPTSDLRHQERRALVGLESFKALLEPFLAGAALRPIDQLVAGAAIPTPGPDDRRRDARRARRNPARLTRR